MRKSTKLLLNIISMFSVNAIASSQPLETSNIEKRLSAYEQMNKVLIGMSDKELSAALKKSENLGTGTGGQIAKFEIDAIPLFIKRIPLTNIEQSDENNGSTANIFNLPLFYQYGVGSRGFGAWRELKTHIKATEWVLTSENHHFPILYHWRVLPKLPPQNITQDEQKKFDDYIKYWGDSASLRKKEEALRNSEQEIVLFFETFPISLHEWFKTGPTDDQKLLDFEEQISSILDFLHCKGVYHFDSHLNNILTDGSSLYFTDFGLSTDLTFSLSQEERDFVSHHKNYDLALSMSGMVFNILRKVYLEPDVKMKNKELIRILDKKERGRLSQIESMIVNRWLLSTKVISIFFDELRSDSTKQTAFPEFELQQAISLKGTHKDL